jgi:hypothetical protein
MRPVAMISTPFSGTMPRRDTADFHTTPEILALSSFSEK